LQHQQNIADARSGDAPQSRSTRNETIIVTGNEWRNTTATIGR